VRTILTAFFGAIGIIHHKFVPKEQTVNSEFYKRVNKRLIFRVHRVRPEFQVGGCLFIRCYGLCSGTYLSHCQNRVAY
jgi:hypothetical protein